MMDVISEDAFKRLMPEAECEYCTEWHDMKDRADKLETENAALKELAGELARDLKNHALIADIDFDDTHELLQKARDMGVLKDE